MKRAFLFLLIVLFSCASHTNGEEQLFKVQTYSVAAGSAVRSVSFPGRVKASEELNLAFKVSGKIENIYVKEGSFVKRGTLLAEIDSKDYRTLLDAADAKFNQISSEAGRVVRLFQDSVVSANDYDKARYGLQQAEATLDLARRQVDDCKLYAPVDGYIQKRVFEPSSIVGSGLPVIKMLSAGVPLIEIEIPASLYLTVSKVHKCIAKFANDVVQPLELKIENIQPKANANQLYTLTFSIVSKNVTMPKPGMATMVDIDYKIYDESDMDSSVPSGAVFVKDGISYIWIIDGDNTVHSHPVSVRSLKADGAAILDELLPEGTNVVSAGVHKLHEGQKVEILEKPSVTNEGGIL